MRALLLSLLLVLSGNLMAQDNPVVVMETNKGTITIELFADKAPISVENFLRYTDNELYDGLIFHRVIEGFMIQGGGFNENMVQLSTYEPIKNEAQSDVPNDRGTIAMARTNVVDSATSQFFINHRDNDFLNHGGRDFGYAVFGRVSDGMDVVEPYRTTETMKTSEEFLSRSQVNKSGGGFPNRAHFVVNGLKTSNSSSPSFRHTTIIL